MGELLAAPEHALMAEALLVLVQWETSLPGLGRQVGRRAGWEGLGAGGRLRHEGGGCRRQNCCGRGADGPDGCWGHACANSCASRAGDYVCVRGLLCRTLSQVPGLGAPGVEGSAHAF